MVNSPETEPQIPFDPAAFGNESTLREQVSSGVFWTGSARAAQQAAQFALSVVLARLLSPNDYGLIAMAFVVTGFAGMLADAGFNAALIQRKELRDDHIHTVFWMTLGSGIVLAEIAYLLAPLVAEFFQAPPLDLVLRVLGITFIIGSIGNVPSALLQRSMRFRAIAQLEFVSVVVSGIVGVVMAFRGAGVWSLVAQALTASLLTTAFRCSCCKWFPRLIFSLSALKDIWTFSGHFYGFNFINYWARNADNLVVGKYFGAPALGAYSRAYALMLLPITQFNSVITQVIFPALSTIQHDKERVKRIYLRAIGVVTLLAFPTMLGLLVVAEPFVLALYGVKWREVTGLLQILALVGAMQVIVNSTGWIFLSQGRTKLLFRWGLCLSMLTISSFGIGAMLGSVRSVAYCYAFANFVFFFPGVAVAAGVINMTLKEVLSAVVGPFLISVAMAAVVASVHRALPVNWLPWQILVVLTTTGVISYTGLAFLFRLSALQDVKQNIRERARSCLAA